MKHPTLAMSCLLLLFGPCSGPTGVEEFRAELRTDQSYALGEVGLLTLENTGHGAIEVIKDLCLAELERQVDGEWEGFGVDEAVCPLATANISPGGTEKRKFDVSLDPFQSGKEYRFSISVRNESTQESAMIVTSNSFRVTEQP